MKYSLILLLLFFSKIGLAFNDPFIEHYENFSDSLIKQETYCNYVDANPSDWWYDSVQSLCSKGILDDNSLCEPIREVNRAELAKLIYISLNLSDQSFPDDYPCPFNDLQDKNDAWYYHYAKNLSYLEYNDNTPVFNRDYFNFYPSKGITRAHTLKAILEAWNIDETNHSSINPYSDVTSDHDAYNYIIKAKDLGLIKIPDDGLFYPNRMTIRAEVFQMLHNILTVSPQPLPIISNDDYYIPGNYTPSNFNNFEQKHSGNFNYYTKSSFKIPAIGVPLTFGHTYNSYLSDMPNELMPIKPLGRLWTHNYNYYLQVINGDPTRETDDRVILTLPNGGFHSFRFENYEYVAETKGVYAKLVKLNNNNFTYTTKSKLVYSFEKLTGSAFNHPFVLTSIKDKNGNSLNIFYEDANESQFKRISSVQETTGRELYFKYHTDSDLIKEITDVVNRKVSFLYDTEGYLISYIDAKGEKTDYIYGIGAQKEMLVKIKLPKGNIIKNTYNKKKLSSSQNGNNSPREYVYNVSNGYKTNINYPNGAVTSIDYNSAGSPIKIANSDLQLIIDYNSQHVSKPKSISYNGNSIKYDYDINGNIVKEYLPLGVVHEYSFFNNRLISYKDPNGVVYKYDYDDNSNLRSISTPKGSIRIYYDSRGLVTEIRSPSTQKWYFEYDKYGNLIKTTTKEGISEFNTYDQIGRLISHTDANGGLKLFNYDANDNLLSEIFGVQKNSFEYDANDNLVGITNAKDIKTNLVYNNEDMLVSVESEGHKDVYSYYNSGLIKTHKKPNGVLLSYEYDEKGRLIRESSTDNSVLYSYDIFDRIVSITNENGKISFNYDKLSRIISTTDYYNNTLSYVYDDNNNIVQLIYPNGKLVKYEYYDDNLLKSVKDWNDNITLYKYRADGLLSTIIYPNGTQCYNFYDKDGRMISKSWKKNDGTIISSYLFQLDLNGNHIQETKKEPFSSSIKPNNDVFYNYNNSSFLLSDGLKSSFYDQNGNTIINGYKKYNYDDYDRLESISRSTIENSYEYDGLGGRRRSKINGQVNRFILDVVGFNKVLLETNDSDEIIYSYVYGLGLISRIDASNQTRYYHYDFRGSTIAMTNDDEKITHKYQYDEFGRIIQVGEEDFNRYRYCGKYGVSYENRDLYFMKARYYNPLIGRFITKDPIWSTNLYPYADNNPITKIDPEGTTPFSLVNNKSVLILKSPDPKVGLSKSGSKMGLEISGAVVDFNSDDYNMGIGSRGKELNFGVSAFKAYGSVSKNGFEYGYSVIGGEIDIDVSRYIPFDLSFEAGIGHSYSLNFKGGKAKVSASILPGTYIGASMRFNPSEENIFYQLGYNSSFNIFELLYGPPENFYK